VRVARVTRCVPAAVAGAGAGAGCQPPSKLHGGAHHHFVRCSRLNEARQRLHALGHGGCSVGRASSSAGRRSHRMPCHADPRPAAQRRGAAGQASGSPGHQEHQPQGPQRGVGAPGRAPMALATMAFAVLLAMRPASCSLATGRKAFSASSALSRAAALPSAHALGKMSAAGGRRGGQGGRAAGVGGRGRSQRVRALTIGGQPGSVPWRAPSSLPGAAMTCPAHQQCPGRDPRC